MAGRAVERVGVTGAAGSMGGQIGSAEVGHETGEQKHLAAQRQRGSTGHDQEAVVTIPSSELGGS